MSGNTLPVRPKGEPRLDIHNANVDQDHAENGLCGTVNLASGSVCKRPALHSDGCEFESPPDTAASGR